MKHPVSTNVLKGLAAAAILGALVIAGYLYVRHEELYPSTQDAYVGANVIRIAAQVSGPVINLYVRDHQAVKGGEPLFEIDPAPFAIAVRGAQAQLELTREQLAAAQAAVDAAEALVEEHKAQLEEASRNAERILTLVEQKQLPPAKGDEAQAARKSAAASLAAAQAELLRARLDLGRPGEANARWQAAKAALEEARLNLQHTHVVAPADGTVAGLTLRSGSLVQTGSPLFALIEAGEWWVDANYKETDLERIHPGEPAEVQVDMYPGIIFKGTVKSVSRASGSAFSLLPPENATGNWVKVTQRFPVRVRVLNAGVDHPLRVGASSQVTVDTTESRGMAR